MGTRTLGQIIEAARVLLQDNAGSYRYQDSELYRYVTEAVLEARRVRPDLFLTFGLTTAIPLYDASQATALMPVSDSYFVTIINYVVGRAELREDEYASDGRAAAMLAMFANSLMNGFYK